MIIKIRQVGDPVLRRAARELDVREILSSPVQQLIDHMRETLRDAPGVGLAAPQIGEPLQLAVIEDTSEYQKLMTEAELKERNRQVQPFHVLINPHIEVVDDMQNTFFEGCLSLPGHMALVPRANSVKVVAFDHRAEQRIIHASGWYARILQHEIDHLRGTLYLDSMQSRSFSTLENHKLHWRSVPRPDGSG